MKARLDDDERALASLLGADAAAPRRSDEAFARAVMAEVSAVRRRSFTSGIALWSGAGAVAALVLFVALSSSPVPSGAPPHELLSASLAALADAEPADPGALQDEELIALASGPGSLELALDDGPLDDGALDEGELMLDSPVLALSDDELLALRVALDEALSL